MEEKRICARCAMDNSDPSIQFDENGICNYCTEAFKRLPLEYFPNEKGQQQLDAIMQTIKDKGRNKPYDCMVGVSGGLDSSYVVYLGYKYGLRMLCVHVDDGLDTETAVNNINNLCKRAGAEIVYVRPNMEQYKDLTRAFFLAGVPGLAIPQDNILLRALQDTAKSYDLEYSLSGLNFSMESILQRGENPINACDKKHIKAIHKRFGKVEIDDIKMISLFDRYISRRYFSKVKTVCPLNLIDYRMDKALSDLEDFCGYVYYGGKHYESILTRFLQCFYLPEYFNFDKRKSHLSSLIVSGQMTREDALKELEKSPYKSAELLKADKAFLADFIGMTEAEFEELLNKPKRAHDEYPTSVLNKIAPIARRFRRFLG